VFAWCREVTNAKASDAAVVVVILIVAVPNRSRPDRRTR